MNRIAFLFALLAVPAFAQETTPATSKTIQDALNQLVKGKNITIEQQQVEQAIATGALLNCVERDIGKEPTRVFWNEMNAVGKQVEAHCKAQQPEEARALVLKTLHAKKGDPVVATANRCYTANAAQITTLAGEAGNDVANYARWSQNPTLAEQEMTTHDICR